MRVFSWWRKCLLLGSAFVITMIWVILEKHLKGSYIEDIVRHLPKGLNERTGIENSDRDVRMKKGNITLQSSLMLNKHDLDPGKRYPRVLCWVMTDPKVLNKTYNVRDTWTKRCDKALFMSSARNDTFPTVGLNVTAGRNHISEKCRASWIYIYEHHIKDYDFFVKADPDTYIVVENLKEYLSHYNPEEPQFFGHRYNLTWGLYMAGGPGVILSRSAVKLLVTKALYNETVTKSCFPKGQGEDWKVCKCLAAVGAKPVDTLDEKGRERFFVLALGSVFHGKFPKWYRDRDRSLQGNECCSDYPIGFHYIGKDNFLVFEYFLYHTKLKYIYDDKLLWH